MEPTVTGAQEIPQDVIDKLKAKRGIADAIADPDLSEQWQDFFTNTLDEKNRNYFFFLSWLIPLGGPGVVLTDLDPDQQYYLADFFGGESSIAWDSPGSEAGNRLRQALVGDFDADGADSDADGAVGEDAPPNPTESLILLAPAMADFHWEAYEALQEPFLAFRDALPTAAPANPVAGPALSPDTAVVAVDDDSSQQPGTGAVYWKNEREYSFDSGYTFVAANGRVPQLIDKVPGVDSQGNPSWVDYDPATGFTAGQGTQRLLFEGTVLLSLFRGSSSALARSIHGSKNEFAATAQLDPTGAGDFITKSLDDYEKWFNNARDEKTKYFTDNGTTVTGVTIKIAMTKDTANVDVIVDPQEIVEHNTLMLESPNILRKKEDTCSFIQAGSLVLLHKGAGFDLVNVVTVFFPDIAKGTITRLNPRYGVGKPILHVKDGSSFEAVKAALRAAGTDKNITDGGREEPVTSRGRANATPDQARAKATVDRISTPPQAQPAPSTPPPGPQAQPAAQPQPATQAQDQQVAPVVAQPPAQSPTRPQSKPLPAAQPRRQAPRRPQGDAPATVQSVLAAIGDTWRAMVVPSTLLRRRGAEMAFLSLEPSQLADILLAHRDTASVPHAQFAQNLDAARQTAGAETNWSRLLKFMPSGGDSGGPEIVIDTSALTDLDASNREAWRAADTGDLPYMYLNGMLLFKPSGSSGGGDMSLMYALASAGSEFSEGVARKVGTRRRGEVWFGPANNFDNPNEDREILEEHIKALIRDTNLLPRRVHIGTP